MKKLVKEWLKELPKQFRDEAVSANKKDNPTSNMIVDSMHKAIEMGFIWGKTPKTEKNTWNKIYEIYKKNNNKNREVEQIVAQKTEYPIRSITAAGELK